MGGEEQGEKEEKPLPVRGFKYLVYLQVSCPAENNLNAIEHGLSGRPQ